MITNRRGAKALEKIAQAQVRLAEAEEKMYALFLDLLAREDAKDQKAGKSSRPKTGSVPAQPELPKK
jgi:hypothetical protein